jgi:S1-C subfamily serine protease
VGEVNKSVEHANPYYEDSGGQQFKKSDPNGIYISWITADGPAHRQGVLHVGDKVLSINGKARMKCPDECPSVFEQVLTCSTRGTIRL